MLLTGRRAESRAAIVAAVLVLAACSGGPKAHGDRDSGPPKDAWPPDAARPVLDSGGRDAAPDPDDPGWVALPGIREGCRIERATRPEALFAPVWEPCDGIDGCRRLVPPGPYWAYETDRGNGFVDDGRGYFIAGRSNDIIVLAATEGPPLAAWRTDGDGGLCVIYPNSVWSGAAAYLTQAGGDWPTWQTFLFHAPMGEIGRLDRGFEMERGAPNAVWVTPELVGLEYRSIGLIALYRDGIVHWMDWLPDGMSGQPMGLTVIGDHAFWAEWGTAARVAHGSIEQPTSLFLEAEGGDLKGFATDGVDMSWQQAYDRDGPSGPYARVELWTAPYVEDPAAIVGRRIAQLPTHEPEPVLGGGHVAWASQLDDDPLLEGITVHDLRDGRRRIFRAPGDETVRGNPVYITATEMLVPCRAGPSPVADVLYRIEIDSLPYE